MPSKRPGAVGILWTGLQFFRYRCREHERYLLLAGVLIAILPWLNIRFWSLAGPEFLVLGAWVVRREWEIPGLKPISKSTPFPLD